jgi:hypothetical protein
LLLQVAAVRVVTLAAVAAVAVLEPGHLLFQVRLPRLPLLLAQEEQEVISMALFVLPEGTVLLVQ